MLTEEEARIIYEKGFTEGLEKGMKIMQDSIKKQLKASTTCTITSTGKTRYE